MWDFDSDQDLDEYDSDFEEIPDIRPDLQDAFMELVNVQRPNLMERPFFLSRILGRGGTHSQILMTGFPRPEWVPNGWLSEDEVKTFCDQEESERVNDCPQVSVDPLETLLDLIGTLDINPLCRPFKIAKEDWRW